MGKRARKTRWRALDIADDHSDSEESNTNSSAVSSRYSQSNSNGYYSRYSYSSQSTPARRRHNLYDGSTKSTRSSSTTSENKITFNEDEYTRITTPRQDVLFKKGYLNKPKNYQTQTSTGNSTISTGNSTENGTPDHQSTHLDYESQFMFPNGFVDQNGIYYVNSYEPYPLMVFNPPTYFHEFSNNKSKRYSTGSLSESMSPNNEEATSQDLSQSGGEASNSGVSDYSGGPPVFNMIYPGYYVNDACTPPDLANGHNYPPESVKKLKKRRERKSSKNISGDSSEFTDENSGDEHSENNALQNLSIPEDSTTDGTSRMETPTTTPAEDSIEAQNSIEEAETSKTANVNLKNIIDHSLSNGCSDKKTEFNEETLDTVSQLKSDCSKSSLLKPDAEEFVPRAYQPMGPPPHIKMIPPNFMPIPLVPIGGDFGAQNFAPHPAFIPPGIPINFIPHALGQKIFPPAQGFVSYAPPMVPEAKIEEIPDSGDAKTMDTENERESTATPSHTPIIEESKAQSHSKIIDIATVVSKLEAVKQQKREDPIITEENKAKPVMNESKPFKAAPRAVRPQNFKKNYYNKYRNSPVRSGEASPRILMNGDAIPSSNFQDNYRYSPVRTVEGMHAQGPNEMSSRNNFRNSPVRRADGLKNVENIQKPFINGVDKILVNGNHITTDFKQNPEKNQKKYWKPNGYQNNHNSPKKVPNQYQKPSFINGTEKPYIINGNMNFHKNYSESTKKVDQKPESLKIEKSNGDVEETKADLTKTKSNNEWISVSNRKKKKNKNFEDFDADTNDDAAIDISVELFESYDVSQLVDVVPLSQVENQKLEVEEKRIENILIDIAKNEATELLANAQTADINIPEVSDIEKAIVNLEEKSEPAIDIHINEEKIEISAQVEENILDLSVSKESEVFSNSLEEETYKSKKKSKKGTQKPLMKKVIITDIFNDLSIETNTPLKKVEKQIEELKPVISEPQVLTAAACTEPLLVKEPTPEIATEVPEKKSKKKKKNKSAKSVQNGNDLAPGDSYNGLLENSLTSENLTKTNDEISLELDKLIQKGMYNSLHEKIKSINIDTDDFFKNINSAITTGKDTPATTSKTPDFNRIFQSTRQFLKPNLVSVEHDNKDIRVDVDKDTKSCSSAADAANPSAGPILDNVREVQKAPVDPETPDDADKKLYPITQAVKEWMSKTREATPEVEILKSPSTIQKEFGTIDTPENGLKDFLDSDIEDEEIILFSSKESVEQEQPDLLEYWENELPVISKDCDLSKDIDSDATKVCADGKSCDKCRTDSIKEEEEEIEVYKSKYGENEAFLHLQQEMRENQHSAPRPGHLPYRAVCCSLQ